MQGIPQGAAASSKSPVLGDAEALLVEMQGQAAIERVGVGSTAYQASVIPKMRYSHEAMADLILANPWLQQNQIAAYFGRTAGWVSTIITSDAFQSLLASRRAELFDPELRVTLEERFKALTAQSLKVLQEKLCRPASEVPDQLALRAAELGAKALGIGGNAPPPAAPNPAEYLPMLAERLMKLQGRPPLQEISDATIVQG